MYKTVSGFICAAFLIQGCFTLRKNNNLYESAAPKEQARFKEVRLPFKAGAGFRVSQGAFGSASHSEPGNEYQWDFDVAYGTPVVAVQAGKVIDIWEPKQGGGCDSKFSAVAHNLKIRHKDGSVAQYVHIEPRVKRNQLVNEGELIAVTALNGWICEPQLHFGVYRSEKHLYTSPTRESIPLRFRGLPGGMAHEGAVGVVP